MRSAPRGGGAPAPGERGFALIAILALAAMIAAYLISIGLSRSSTELATEREDRSMSALMQAKAALIAYAANEEWQAYKSQTTNQPGGLPCPDANDTGTSSGVCPGPANRVGRLPWSTIGSEDLRDAGGERLWYAVSSNFYKNSLNIINSDTQGTLNVINAAPANNAVAIVFAPGPALQSLGQNRDPTNVAAHNNPANYLENFNPGFDTFWSSTFPTDTFNDRLLVITQAELMSAVEPVVAARLERDIKPSINSYFGDWGIYPYAAPFSAPDPGRDQSLYQGATSQTNGLLPLTNTGWAGWKTSPISSIDVCQCGGSGSLDSFDCSASTVDQLSCTLDYSGGGGGISCGGGCGGGGFGARPIIRIRATLLSVARSFLRPASLTDLTIQDNTSATIGWLASPAPTVSNALQSSGDAQVQFTGRLPDASSTPRPITITVPASYYPIVQKTDPTTGWFTANKWFRQTYYAVAPDFLLGGGGNCVLNPPCLTVNKLPPSYTTSNDKRVILVFAGHALNGAPRPSANLTDYFESENSTPADFVYEHRSGVPTSINDRVVIISP